MSVLNKDCERDFKDCEFNKVCESGNHQNCRSKYEQPKPESPNLMK